MSAERIDYSWIPAATILLGEHGSRAHGTHSPESDRDLTGICAEPRRFVTGLQRFDVLRYNSAGEGIKSGAEDMDTSVLGLRKWAALAQAGNPNALLPLFMPEYEILTEAGQILIENRSTFLSSYAITKHFGYMGSQRHALLGESKTLKPREDLVEAHGYDSKYAGSMLIAGMRCLSLVRDQKLTLPLGEDDRDLIRRVRAGTMSLSEVLAIADNLADRIRHLEGKSKLPEFVDSDAVDLVLDRVYAAAWADSAGAAEREAHPAFMAA